MTPFAAGAPLREASRAPSVDIDALAGRGVLVLAPHPDDETLGCGAALATLVRSGHRAHVVAVTDGGGSHPGSTLWPRARLARHRANELAEAIGVLGDGRITHDCLGFPDQGTPEPSDPRVREAFGQLATRMRVDGPFDTIWTTWEGDPHPDHVRAAALADTLADALEAASGTRPAVLRFPVWGRFVERSPTASGDELVRFAPSDETRAIKALALACHASQMSALIDDDPDGFVMPAPMQRHFVEHDELFVRSRPA